MYSQKNKIGTPKLLSKKGEKYLDDSKRELFK